MTAYKKKYRRLQHKILVKHVLASTCGTQGQQHRGVSEHNNAHYHPSPAHLKMQWFIAFFYLFIFLLLTHCFSAFLRKLKFSTLRIFHTPHFPNSALSTLRTFYTPHSAFSTEPWKISRFDGWRLNFSSFDGWRLVFRNDVYHTNLKHKFDYKF